MSRSEQEERRGSTIPWAAPFRRLLALRLSARFGVDVALGALLLVVGALAPEWPLTAPIEVLAVAALSLAVRRLSPTVALALGWMTALLQVNLQAPPSIVQIATAAVVFSAATWGSRFESAASAVSVLVGGLAFGVYLLRMNFASITLQYGVGENGRTGAWLLAVLLPVVVLGVCWAAGFALRSLRAQRSASARRDLAEGRAAVAQEQAGMEQTRTAMARDVHDVVGHSLAVIVAQADSVRFITDTDRVREVVSTIAATARSSLLEVRGVLERTEGQRPPDGTDLDALVAQVRSTGAEIRERTDGDPGPLEAASGMAARRVLQEMLTNALRHGRPGAAVEVQRLWRAADLVIEVTNVIGDGGSAGSGAGLSGMRQRVESVGGSLETDRLGDRFVARARVPRAVQA